MNGNSANINKHTRPNCSVIRNTDFYFYYIAWIHIYFIRMIRVHTQIFYRIYNLTDDFQSESETHSELIELWDHHNENGKFNVHLSQNWKFATYRSWNRKSSSSQLKQEIHSSLQQEQETQPAKTETGNSEFITTKSGKLSLHKWRNNSMLETRLE
jgi:hypothetical protein